MIVDEKAVEPITMDNTNNNNNQTENNTTVVVAPKPRSEMLQLLTDYMLDRNQTTFTFVKGDSSTCSQKEQWVVQALLLKSS